MNWNRWYQPKSAMSRRAAANVLEAARKPSANEPTRFVDKHFPSRTGRTYQAIHEQASTTLNRYVHGSDDLDGAKDQKDLL